MHQAAGLRRASGLPTSARPGPRCAKRRRLSHPASRRRTDSPQSHSSWHCWSDVRVQVGYGILQTSGVGPDELCRPSTPNVGNTHSSTRGRSHSKRTPMVACGGGHCCRWRRQQCLGWTAGSCGRESGVARQHLHQAMNWADDGDTCAYVSYLRHLGLSRCLKESATDRERSYEIPILLQPGWDN